MSQYGSVETTGSTGRRDEDSSGPHKSAYFHRSIPTTRAWCRMTISDRGRAVGNLAR
jgi:hypothetical protein